MRRDDLIDFLLDELEPEQAHAAAAEIARDPEAAAERDRFSLAIDLVREVAAEGWEAPAPSRAAGARWLRPALAAAAVLLVAVGLFLLDRDPRGPLRVYEPDGSFGAVLPEETDAAGNVRDPGLTGAYRLRGGRVEIAALGSDKAYPLETGETIPPETSVTTPADSAARIDLPHGGILFMGPLAEVRVRRHANGEAALRLVDGLAYTVAGARTLHLAVDETDLLLDQESGAALLRAHPAETICMRGDLYLRLADGARFKVPETERLPAACAKAPRTAPVKHEELELEEWYFPLQYEAWRSECVMWTRPGLSEPIDDTTDQTLIYLRVVAAADGELKVAFGGPARRFRMAKGTPLELRLRLKDLGEGPVLTVEPASAVKQARVFEGTPR